jgi:hypothetical protein
MQKVRQSVTKCCGLADAGCCYRCNIKLSPALRYRVGRFADSRRRF